MNLLHGFCVRGMNEILNFMKTLVLLSLLLISFFGFNQVKFTESTFENGFRYPIMVYSDNPVVQDSVNAKILRSIQDLKTSDFCIGDYGFVQKGNHLELHLVCNCIDMTVADHRYLLFNLVEGTLVNHPDVFDSKKRDLALKIISISIRKAKETNTCVADFGDMEKDLDFTQMNIRFYRDGLEIRPIGTECDKTPVKVLWTELSSCLKYNFI